MKIYLLNHNSINTGTYFRAKSIQQVLSEKHEVTLLTVSNKKFDLKIRSYYDSNGCKIILLPKIQYSQYFNGQILRFFITLYFLLFNKIDVIYAFAFSQPQIAYPSIIKKILSPKIRLIVDWDDLWGNGLGLSHNFLINKLFLFNETKFFKHFDHITCASIFLKRYIKKLNNNVLSTYIPNFTDKRNFKQFNNIPDSQGMTFTLIGNIYGNAYGYLDQIFVELKKKIKISINIVGYTKDEFNNLFKTYDISQMKFYGRVNDHKLLEPILDGTNFMLMPTENNKFERSRFPIKFIHYLNYNLPIMTNIYGEAARYLNKYKTGFVLSGYIVDDINKIINIYDKKNYLELGKKNNKIFNENFNEDVMKKKLFEIF